MARPIHLAQEREAERYRRELAAYKNLSAQERNQGTPPTSSRGYFVSDFTLEGLREDLDNSPHGGILVIQDEVSAFITGQNQYKARGGTDRESSLALWDGHPIRVTRVGKDISLDGARVSILGGIQPKVFRTVFGGAKGLYLTDGTLFRFLLTYDPPTYYELTPESWEDHRREKWDTLLHQTMTWVDKEIVAQGGKIKTSRRLILDSESQVRFFEWRNELHSVKVTLPAILRGFLPKAYEYALRLTGVIHCIHKFSLGETPRSILTLEDLNRGIKAVSFYLGQVQGALRLIENEDFVPREISERSLLLAKTLDQLRSRVDNGRLAVGFIQEHYNEIAPKTQEIRTPKALGGLIRNMGMTISPGKHDANGSRAARCLEWDSKTESFIQECLQSLQCQESQDWQGLEDADFEEPMSAMSAPEGKEPTDIADISERTSAPETHTSSAPPDNADVADIMEVEI
jgi:hypothetical protein